MGWNLKTPLDTRATVVTELQVCPRPQWKESATLSRGTVVSMVCKPLPFPWIRIHTGDPQESKLWLSQSRWALLQLYSRETERQHMELTQVGCRCQVKSTVACWSMLPSHNEMCFSQRCLSALRLSPSLKATKTDETQIPLKSWSFGTDLTEWAFHPKTSLSQVSKEIQELKPLSSL